jgi:hypothetical protein
LPHAHKHLNCRVICRRHGPLKALAGFAQPALSRYHCRPFETAGSTLFEGTRP